MNIKKSIVRESNNHLEKEKTINIYETIDDIKKIK